MRTKIEMDRRSFLRSSGALVCGLTAAAAFLPNPAPAAEAGPGGSDAAPNVFGPREGYSPQIGTLVSMLNWMRGVILGPVQGLTVRQLDYLHDAKANSIGALLLHLAAIERLYQIHTFEDKKWGDVDEETKKEWNVPAALGKEARKSIKGHDLAYYLDKLKAVRERTLTELKKRDDAWLMQVDRDSGWGPTNNYCKWFHVCEHESNHNGQVKWIKSRLPA
ncbi:MAG TPA: DUF664 domain-containing protein [Chthoniobacterales bacterium]|nr:DUF664 domain-containing protein [Chthoniobacterales bacterium]